MNLSKSLKVRCHEWLADHFSFIQYPNIRGPRITFFKNEMPSSTRALLVLIGCITLIGCLIAMFFLGLLAWAAVTA